MQGGVRGGCREEYQGCWWIPGKLQGGGGYVCLGKIEVFCLNEIATAVVRDRPKCSNAQISMLTFINKQKHYN